jgi:hypothetical protein
MDVFAICANYVSTLQTKHQLVSPLIPKNLVAQVVYDAYDLHTSASLICAGLFLTGLWFYSFRKKASAAVLFFLALTCFVIYPMMF